MLQKAESGGDKDPQKGTYRHLQGGVAVYFLDGVVFDG
jgi:hypothetical protein